MTNVRCNLKQSDAPTFGSIANFTWFLDPMGKPYIKVRIYDELANCEYNVIDLQSGCYDYFESNEHIIPIKSLTITIDDN